MTNNINIIKPLLEFPHNDIFYFVQILQRKKDHKGTTLAGSNNNSRTIKNYYINSIEKLDHQYGEMKKLAEVFDARVMINLNPRNFKKAAFATMVKMSNQMSNGDFYNIRNAFSSVCGEYHSEIDKRWIIDLDKGDLGKKDNIIQTIQNHQTLSNCGYKIIAEIPSKTGIHLITNPFNPSSLIYWNVEIHKNNPTNLYIP